MYFRKGDKYFFVEKSANMNNTILINKKSPVICENLVKDDGALRSKKLKFKKERK